MRLNLKSLLLGVVLSHLAITAGLAADGGRKDLGDVLNQFTPATHYIWTDSTWYMAGSGNITARWTAAANGDPYPYTIFVYLENVETGARQYVNTVSGTLSDTVVDAFGNGAGNYAPTVIPTVSGTELITIPVPGDAAYWHFVAELRDVTGTRVVKSAWAKFPVVSSEVMFTEQNTEISSDTTWTNDAVYRIANSQVFVNSGATLTIEPGTVIVAAGQNAVMVVERGGQMMADGRREMPIVFTCDAPIGQRQSGCWAGLIVLGAAPANVAADEAIAEGVIPADRPVYGGDDEMDSSGVYRYVRSEFGGVDFTSEIQPNGIGWHGVGSGTTIEYVQSHEGEDDGIEFFGGTANAKNIVMSGAKDDSLDWTFGWSGYVQNVFVIQDPVLADQGIEADNNSDGRNNMPRSNPKIYNATFVGSFMGSTPSGDIGLLLREGTAASINNCIVMGFGEEGLFVDDPETQALIGTELLLNSCIFWNNLGAQDSTQIDPTGIPLVDAGSNVFFVNPGVRNARWEPNPDPRLVDGAAAGTTGAAVTPPSNGFFDTSTSYHGAFGFDSNWLDEWTWFGSEDQYTAQ